MWSQKRNSPAQIGGVLEMVGEMSHRNTGPGLPSSRAEGPQILHPNSPVGPPSLHSNQKTAMFRILKHSANRHGNVSFWTRLFCQLCWGATITYYIITHYSQPLKTKTLLYWLHCLCFLTVIPLRSANVIIIVNNGNLISTFWDTPAPIPCPPKQSLTLTKAKEAGPLDQAAEACIGSLLSSCPAAIAAVI